MRDFFMRFLRSVAVVLSFFAFAFPAAAQPLPSASSREQIRTYAARIVVNDDGTIGVDETVGYFFPVAVHGIERDITLRDDAGGTTTAMTVARVSVRDGDSRPVPFTTENDGKIFRIRIAAPHGAVAGVQTYDIEYTASGALRYASDRDVLRWNVTGDEWKVPIGSIFVSVVLPKDAPRNQITTKCSAGPTGGCLTPPSVGASADFSSDGGPLTVIVGWPHGLVAELPPTRVSSWENFRSCIPLLSVVVIICLFFFWKIGSRDHRDKKSEVKHQI
jgi:hypothetical protein